MSGVKLTALIGATWVCLAAAIVFFVGSINLSRLVAIARSPEPAEATVTRTDCSNHASVYYNYQVGQQTFSGRTSMGARCQELKTGDGIRIHYAGSQPALSEASDPIGALINELVAIGLMAFFFPPMAIVSVLLHIRRRRTRVRSGA